MQSLLLEAKVTSVGRRLSGELAQIKGNWPFLDAPEERQLLNRLRQRFN